MTTNAAQMGISIRLLLVRVALEDLVLVWAELDMN
jgi:hypothetical protein